MKTVFTAKEMAGVDSYAINKMNIPGVILMENAGRGIADIARRLLQQPQGKLVYIFCGPGNNGGDGYVVARHLLNHGARVRTFVLAAADKIKGDALVNLQILQNIGQQPEFIQEAVRPRETPDLVIDAMLGTGVKGALKGLYAQTADIINSLDCPVLAVDIPSGVNADTGHVAGPAVRADVTATMAAPKRGLLFSPGREYAGRLEIVDISMPPKVVDKRSSKVWLVDEAFIKSILPKRSPDAHKNKVGMVQMIAGSAGFTGAAALASEAVLRSGAGLCYLAAPKSLNAIFENKLTEVITQPVADNDAGYFTMKNLKPLLANIEGKDVIAIGPGIGQALQTAALIHELFKILDKPLVLDADGLNVFAGKTELFNSYAGDLILTPHPGEFSRLTGLPAQEIIVNRVEITREYARKWDCVIVLKGGPSITATPDGAVYITATGNAGMATGGSGDVLTGIIAALLGQGAPVVHAAVAAVYVHGLAGDLAAKKYGRLGMTAGDILKQTPRALKLLQRGDF